ncbi:MAG: peptidylprolyl isomerase, partial [Tepidiformaceae bacterium]
LPSSLAPADMPDATALPSSLSPADMPEATALPSSLAPADMRDVTARAVTGAPPPSPSAQTTPPTAGRRSKRLLAGAGVLIAAAGAIAAVVILTNGGSGKSEPTPSPTVAVVANATGTAGPTATPAPIQPTVFPPSTAHFSILTPGAAARVVDSPPGADGQCAVAIWAQPSDVASTSNQLVQRLCTGDAVAIGASPPTFAGGATWWQVTADATKASGWVEEVTADGSHRFLALPNLQFTAPEDVVDTNSNYTAIIITPEGSMRVALYADQSPRTVNNFVFLAEKGVYDGTTFFHLTQSLIEGGDPTGTGNGDAGYQLAVEGNAVRNVRGAIVMSSVVGQFGSKFFIYTADTPSLDFDGTELTKVFPFGQVTAGLDVLDKIAATATEGANIAVAPVPIANIVIEKRPK